MCFNHFSKSVICNKTTIKKKLVIEENTSFFRFHPFDTHYTTSNDKNLPNQIARLCNLVLSISPLHRSCCFYMLTSAVSLLGPEKQNLFQFVNI